jgi:nitrogen-specific signal transduction histidine kinase
VAEFTSEKKLVELEFSSSDQAVEKLARWLASESPPGESQLDQQLCELTALLGAKGAWVLLRDPTSSQPRLEAGCLERKGQVETLSRTSAVAAVVQQLAVLLSANEIVDFCVLPSDGLRMNKISFSHVVAFPLMDGRVDFGTALFGYGQEPRFSPIQTYLLKLAASKISKSITSIDDRHPREILTLQANLTGLIAKIIDPATDLDRLLALTLEHTVLPLGASLGCIWLIKPSEDDLELGSSLVRVSRTKLPQRIQLERGLVGKVVQSCLPILTNSPSEHPGFDADADSAWGDFGTVLMLPLNRHEIQFGVLCLCWDQTNAVSDAELVIIESISDLVSAFITNINLIDQLSSYSIQQNALLEMSRQIALGLDLETTIARGLQWVTRLLGVEFGLLWLMDRSTGEFHLEASIGSGLNEVQGMSLPLDDENAQVWQGLLEPVVVPEPDLSSPFWLPYDDLFGIRARDLIVLPLESRGELVGMVLLINRIGGLTLESEPAMLATAADMVALAVGNAQLYSQTLDLIDERERAHALALQATRLATVGRLTATLSHEINNPMQAIRGALSLAQEEMDDSESLCEYLDMCIHESDRVVDLIEKMRHVYLPKSEDGKPFHLNDVLQEVMVFAQKVSSRQGVEIDMTLAPDLPLLQISCDQIHLVILSLTLNLSDAIAAGGGDSISIRTLAGDQSVAVEFVTKGDPNTLLDMFLHPGPHPLTEADISLAFSQDIIRSLDGDLQFTSEGDEILVTLSLPAQSEKIAQPENV